MAATSSGSVLDAVHAATVAISAETSLEAVLQLIVDRVRPLVHARYAALGILDGHGGIERFITSGVDADTRQRIGDPPRGRGILGLIVTENRTIRIRDLMTDPRGYGFPPNHPTMHSFLGVPVPVEGRSIGNLYLTEKWRDEEFTLADERIVETFASHAGIAIHNARLHAEVQRLAVDHERERIGQDLHDGVIQSLYGVSLSLEDVGELMRTDPADAEERVEHAIDAIHGTIRDLRSFIFGLRPEALAETGLDAALLALAEEFRRSSAVDTDVEVSVDEGAESWNDPDTSLQLLQLAREALSNVARHSRASHVQLTLYLGASELRLRVADDGVGFDLDAGAAPGHHGLSNMRARTESLGGTLGIDSAPGAGTRIIFRLPRASGPSTRST